MHDNIFEKVKSALQGRLDLVLSTLLPDGRIIGKEYVCASLSGGYGNSCKTNLLTGVGADFNTGERWGDVITMYALIHNVDNFQAAIALASKFSIQLNLTNQKGRHSNMSIKNATNDKLISIVPVPDTAPQPELDIERIKQACGIWRYYNAQKELLHLSCRFNKGNGEKEFRPISFCKTKEGETKWVFKALPAPRPLYNLHVLASSPATMPVLLVEGEKTADAAQQIFPDYVSMTWSGGCSGVDAADLLPLKGRNIVIWPDNDKPGFHAALTLIKLLENMETQVSVVLPPDTLPEKWDLADPPVPEFFPDRYIETALSPAKFSMETAARYPSLIQDSRVADDTPALSLKEWPVLSPEALPGLVGEVVDAACSNSEADPAAVLMTFLVRFGVEVYGYRPNCGPYIQIGDTIHPPRLFVVIVGKSAKSRKGTSATFVSRLFSSKNNICVDEIKFARRSGGPLSSGEGLASCLGGDNEEKKQDGITADSLPDNRLFILDEEFASCLRCTKREGNTLSTAVRSFWDSGNYEPLTKHARVRVEDANVGIVTHITVQELRHLIDIIQVVGGLANRFLFACARRPKLVPLPKPIPEDVFKRLYDAVQMRIAQARKLREVKFTSEAEVFWEHIYPDISQDRTGLISYIIARSEPQCLRLALCYALLDGAEVIDVCHLKSALALWRYAEASALYIFGNGNDDSLAHKILEILKSGRKSSSELNKSLGGHIASEKLQECLQELIDLGKISKQTEQTAGRPRTTFFLPEKDRKEDKS